MQKLMIATASGMLAGICIGMLTAPAKGSETRKKITDSADELKKKIKRLAGMATDEIDELKSILEQESEGLKDDVRERILNLIESIKKSTNPIKEEVFG